MSGFDKVAEIYEKKTSFQDMLFEMIQSALDDPRLLSESVDIDKIMLDAWNGIPEPQLSELAWGRATPEGQPGEISMDARTQLEGFLRQIGVGRTDTLRTKLNALEAFFSKSTAKGREGKIINGPGSKTAMKSAGLSMDATGGAAAKENISRIMGYLTFYKTLTRILQNFNASAAGFTFESFMAVLLGGMQVPTGNQTIADMTTGTGRPISLKLLTETAPNVKGSMRDLVNDMVGAEGAQRVDTMAYLVCLKNLTGEAENISGEIKFYEFEFNINNMLDFLTLSTGKKTKMLFQLPLAETGKGIDTAREVFVDQLQPYYSEEVDVADEAEDQEELTSWWVDNYSSIYDSVASEVGAADQSLKSSLLDFLQPNGHPAGGSRGSAAKNLRNWVLENYAPEEVRGMGKDRRNRWAATSPEYEVALRTHETLVKTYNRLATEHKVRKKVLKTQRETGEMWASPEDSVAYLRMLSQKEPDSYAAALTKTRGYIGRIQWIVNKSQIETAAKATGAKEPYIGRLFVGIDHVAEMVNLYRDMVNENIFEIIRELKVLTFYVHKFFAEGFEKSNGDKVIEASNNINEKTESVVEQEGSGPPPTPTQ